LGLVVIPNLEIKGDQEEGNQWRWPPVRARTSIDVVCGSRVLSRHGDQKARVRVRKLGAVVSSAWVVKDSDVFGRARILRMRRIIGTAEGSPGGRGTTTCLVIEHGKLEEEVVGIERSQTGIVLWRGPLRADTNGTAEYRRLQQFTCAN
jgi:hypothetical protein